MKFQSIKRGLQRGFTLVELAIVLVIAGLILTAVLKGTDSINKAKAERAVADLKGLQGLLLEYQKRTGRLPGDCNNNGRIEFYPSDAVYSTDTLDATETSRLLPSPAVNTGVTANCIDTTTATEQLVNVVWNDLRRNNIVDPQRLPRELAKNVNGSYYEVGEMSDSNSNRANVIVVYSIPVWMAEAIDVAIDGGTQYSGNQQDANYGRVRRWDTPVVTTTANTSAVFNAGTFTNGYQKSGETRDSLIAISFQFDTQKLPN